MGAKPQPRYSRIRAINDRVIMRLQCTLTFQGNNDIYMIDFIDAARGCTSATD